MNILGSLLFWVTYNAKKLVGFAMEEGNWFLKVYSAIDKLGFFIVGLVMYGLVYMIDGLTWMQEHLPTIQTMVQTGAGISGGSPAPSGLLKGLQIANSIIPMDEAFVLFQFMAGLWVLTVTFRIVKSWLPTVN